MKAALYLDTGSTKNLSFERKPSGIGLSSLTLDERKIRI